MQNNIFVVCILKGYIAFLRQVRYIFRAETITGQGLGVPHQLRKRYTLRLPNA